MFLEPVSTEIVWQIPQEVDLKQLLKNHFEQAFRVIPENSMFQNAVFESIGDIRRCLSGVPYPFYNGIVGQPQVENWDDFIQEQLRFFKDAETPFAWFLDDDFSPEFKQKLLEYGFIYVGMHRGVIGKLDKNLSIPELPGDCTLELVNDESAMEEFHSLITEIFSDSKRHLKDILWKATKNQSYPMFHWLARKQGKAVSAISTVVSGDVVSFWNGATLPEVRRLGLSTALRCFALKDALSRGCYYGASFLSSEGMAYGICKKLGYETKWTYHIYVAPKSE